ncbi:reverse transcriptase, putative [Ixodes scapularis]|uniref:Reverse transcriptase, putative n=1 Tax=Ixodes scapularis TaxID=6945 RepID=B7Q3Q0_IXOSC|nr:reverse transcriptase, putative [Ixodes scapularis]|eukprot:XP_002411348.1 reverse transcriptase, putative [Ixodes scapularis]
MLRNLPDVTLKELLALINEAWEHPELKEAHIITIPKPGKLSTTVTNLRPIFMESCRSKLMEKMALQRLEWPLEHHGHFAPIVVGFRQHVSTQDVARRIRTASTTAKAGLNCVRSSKWTSTRPSTT